MLRFNPSSRVTRNGRATRGPAGVLWCVLACLVPADAANAQWWGFDWGERKKLVFRNSDQSENLDDFPVLVVLKGSRIDYTKTLNGGEDLRFIDSDDSTVLAHEIEQWDESGTSYVWVKVPRVDGSSDTDFIYMYYDNFTAPDAQDITGVWSNGYAAVWHLNESPANGVAGHIDSAIEGGGLVIDCAAKLIDNNPTAGADQFKRFDESVQGGFRAFGSTQSTDDGTDMSWTISGGSKENAHVGFIAQSTATVSVVDANSTNADSNTIDITSHDVSGSNKVIIVCVVLETTASDKEVQSVTWDQGGSNEALTLFNAFNPGHGKLRIEVWSLANPTSATGKTVRVTIEGGNSQKTGEAAISLSGVTGSLGTWTTNSGIDSEPGPITVGGYDATPENFAGFPGSTTDATGKIGGADEFDGFNDYVKRTVADFLSSDTQGTVTAWSKGGGTVFSSTDESAVTRYLILGVNPARGIEINKSKTPGGLWHLTHTTTWRPSVTAWDYIAWQSDGSSWSLFANGVSQALTVAAQDNDGDWFGDISNRTSFFIGAYEKSDTQVYHNGPLDEVRVSSVARSADWLAAQYKSQSDTFIKWKLRLISWNEIEPN